MKGFRFLILIMAILWTNISIAKTMTREEYIEKYAELAVKEMQRVGVPASITLAQGCLESENGNSMLAIKAKNHFGIKCHKSWTGKTIHKDDDKKNECFRVYKTDYESYVDHSDFLKNGSRYAFLFDLKPTDYKGWAHGLKKAGYATNPKYPQMLIKIIEENQLYKYDDPKYLKNKKTEEKNSQPMLADSENIEPAKSEPHQRVFVKNKKKRSSRYSPTDDIVPAPPIRIEMSDYMIESAVREIQENNGLNYIVVIKGDTFYSLAKKYDLMEWQIYSFNDFEKDHVLKIGEIVYLQMKKNKPEKKYSIHIAKKGESLHSISQIYGVRLKKLTLLNRQKPYEELNEGDKINLVLPR